MGDKDIGNNVVTTIVLLAAAFLVFTAIICNRLPLLIELIQSILVFGRS